MEKLLLQVIAAGSSDVWPANMVSVAMVLTGGGLLIRWFLARFIAENDKKIKASFDVALKALEEVKEVKRNYLERFENVNENVTVSFEKVNSKLEEVNRDKWEHRNKQERTLGGIENELKNLANYCKENINPRKDG